MRNKFISIFLSFVLVFSSCFVSFADEPVYFEENIDVSEIEPYILPGVALSPELIALLGTVAVGSGIVLKNNDDLYDLARLFYDKNVGNWDSVLDAFDKCSIVSPGNLVKVGSSFLDFCKSFFDSTFSSSVSSSGEYLDVEYLGGLPYYNCTSSELRSKYSRITTIPLPSITQTDFYLGDFYFKYASGKSTYNLYLGSTLVASSVTVGYDWITSGNYGLFFVFSGTSGYCSLMACADGITSDAFQYSAKISLSKLGSVVSVPYSGTYDWNGVQEKVNEEDGTVSIGVPGNASDLIGDNVDVFNPTYGLTNGTVALPDVVDPSISVGDSVALPVEGTLEGEGAEEGTETEEGVWGKVKDFVISLVVPSDLFWTEAFEGVYAEFNNSFPMINLDNFKMLVVGGKPFPNIYVNVLGSKSKIVDGDVINSIVDWLRPLIAGFMMLCLMLFNYRKIYKLIRNSEPFGNIAPGTSEFRTGMSAPSMSEGFSSYDIARDQIRDVAFEIRNEILSRKNSGN